MRKLPYLIFLIYLYGCNQTAPKVPVAHIPKSGKFKKMLTKYQYITFDTLQVYSSEELENSQYKFKGIQLDRADVLLLPKIISDQYINDPGFFGCYKLDIDSIRTGLITRTPSVYESSSIKLFIFDKHADSITSFIELAETFGDAGDYAEKTSWLFQDDNNKYKNFTWYTESHDNSVNDEKDTTIQTWNNYYLLDLSKSNIDTISKSEKDLVKKFGNLLKPQANL